jgi:phosphoribosyl 1,2-cyclic phosphodiesterase
MRFASLGSGSEGNALVIEVGDTRVLVDCGFRVRDTVARLARLGVAADSIDAILVTHEHADHIGGVAGFAARYRVPVWLTFGTLEMAGERFARLPQVYGFDSHDVFAVGMVEVRPFPVPHDAREPVQFVVGDGVHRLGILTDIGVTTRYVEASLSGCDALVLECNHDLGMLEDGDYPWPL